MPSPPRPLPTGTASPPPSNVEVVARALREAIVSGWLSPGERIKEVPIARQLGVSRGPVREAIHMLEHEGLLTTAPNRGAWVPEVRAVDVLEVYAMRAQLGSLALHKLMLADHDLPLAALERELARFEAAVADDDGSAAADADLAYQSALVAGARLPRVSQQFELLTSQVRIFIATLDIRYDDKLCVMLNEVATLHRAVVDRDGPLAERLWREKFERWVRDLVDSLDESFDAELWSALTSGPNGSVSPPRAS